MKAAIYARVSTAEQAEKGYSLETQIDACKTHAAAFGVTEIDEYIDDGYSGTFLDRPEMDRLRDNLKTTKYNFVIVYDPDRLARNLAHQLIITEEIEKSGAELKFVSVVFEHSPEGKLFYSIRGAVSDFEKEKIKERTLRGKRRKALKGKAVIARQRFGYNVKNGSYVINEDEAETVRGIFKMCIDGQGLHAITRALNNAGKKNKSGKPFLFKYIYTILRDTLYSGTYYVFREQWTKTGQKKYAILKKPREEWIGITVPAIVSRETQERAWAALESNKKHSRRNAHHLYLLTGLLRCKLCGKNMIALAAKSNKYYVCNGKRREKNCPNSGWIPADMLEEAIWDKLLELAKEKKPLSAILGRVPAVDHSHELARLTTQEHNLKLRKADIVGKIARGLIDSEDAEDALKLLNRGLLEASAAMSAINLSARQAERKIVFNPIEILKAKTPQQKRKILKDMGIIWRVYLENRLKRYGKHLELEFYR